MKHLKPKSEYDDAVNEQLPRASALDTFPRPEYVTHVTLHGLENTSLCPITQQPDYWTVSIDYTPDKTCLESKSLKLYLMSFRTYGAFCEALSHKICEDVYSRLNCPITVTVNFNSRGGIIITATSRRDV